KETVDRWDKELTGKEVKNIYITHYHPDHFGYAGRLQEKTGARLFMTEMDENNGKKAWQEDFLSTLEDNYSIASIPEKIASQMAGNTREFISRRSEERRVGKDCRICWLAN